ADGVVKVADLGLARFSESSTGSGERSSLTQAGMVVGTVDYMSPEQAVDSGTVDHRADVYSLGCTLYFLLTGRPPYEGASLMAIMLKHRDAAIPYLCDTHPDILPELDVIFRRMVAKQPEDRYQSMTEVVRALEQAQTKIRPADALTQVQPPPAVLAGGHDQTVALDSLQATSGPDNVGFDVSPAAVPDTAAFEAARAPTGTVGVAGPSRTQAGVIRNYLRQLGLGARRR